MNKRASVVCLFGIGVLSACGNKTDANEKNFSVAMNVYLEKKGDVCLGLNEWPYTVNEQAAKMKFGNPPRLEALAKAGVVTVSNTTVEVKGRTCAKEN